MLGPPAQAGLPNWPATKEVWALLYYITRYMYIEKSRQEPLCSEL